MTYNLKRIQKQLEDHFDIKFKEDIFGTTECITNTTNRCTLDIYIGEYAEGVVPDPLREHIAFMWSKEYGDHYGMGRGYYTVADVIDQMEGLGYPKKIYHEPEQLSLF